MTPKQLDIARDLFSKYDKLFENWCIANPGKVMCNYGIKLSCLEHIIRADLSLDDIKLKELSSIDKYKTSSGLNGHYITAETCRELINLIESDEV